MGFDEQNKNEPIIQPHKKTTQVNIAIAIAVIVFIAITGVVLWVIASNPEETRTEMHQEIKERD